MFFLIAARYSSGDWHRLVHVRIAGRPGTDLRPQVGAAVRYPAAGHGADHSRHSRTQWTVRPAARFLAAQGCIAYARDLRGHGRTAGPGKLGQAGITAWHDMTADIKQLADIARAEHRDLPLIAFGRSDLLAGAVRQGCRTAQVVNGRPATPTRYGNSAAAPCAPSRFRTA